MGLLDWMRGARAPTPPARPAEDCVWLDGDARLAGLRARLGGLPRRSALVIARDRSAFDAVASALSALGAQGLDGRLDLREALDHVRTPGTVALLDASRLGPPAGPGRTADELVVHVIGRALRRSDDVRLLDPIAGWHHGRVLVHSAMDDPLLRPHVERIEPLLRRMGMTAEHPVESPLIAQAMRRAQRE